MEISPKGIMGQPMRVYKRAKNIGASHRKRPLLEVKQTSRFDGAMSAYDPKRTLQFNANCDWDHKRQSPWPPGKATKGRRTGKNGGTDCPPVVDLGSSTQRPRSCRTKFKSVPGDFKRIATALYCAPFYEAASSDRRFAAVSAAAVHRQRLSMSASAVLLVKHSTGNVLL
jgi:hypothetical protein